MSTRSKPRALREIDIEITCTDFLALDGWRALKTDPCSDKSRGKGFGEKGMADRMYIRYRLTVSRATLPIDASIHEQRAAVELMWIEWKRPKGKAAQHQLDWHTAERARGALVFLAGVDFPADIDAFMEFYRNSGLLRRRGL